MKRRILKIKVFRYNPNVPAVKPFMQDYEYEEKEGDTLHTVLTYIRENVDPTLKFDFVCRAAVCGSCAMLINGKPGLACKTLTSSLSKKIVLQPLPVFKMVGDLSVDTGIWFRALNERTGGWVHSTKSEILSSVEDRFSNDEMIEVYELDRCIECGCCVAGCSTANMNEEFITAAGALKVARFMADPRDDRSDKQWYDVIGTDDGIFGCLSLLACHDFCPKDIPLQSRLAYVRRKILKAGMF